MKSSIPIKHKERKGVDEVEWLLTQRRLLQAGIYNHNPETALDAFIMISKRYNINLANRIALIEDLLRLRRNEGIDLT